LKDGYMDSPIGRGNKRSSNGSAGFISIATFELPMDCGECGGMRHKTLSNEAVSICCRARSR
jgi:hypothetical protein